MINNVDVWHWLTLYACTDVFLDSSYISFDSHNFKCVVQSTDHEIYNKHGRKEGV